jgi:G3E family GTPase
VRIADIVWINKIDLVESTEDIRKKILEINPFANIIETTFGSTGQIDLAEMTQSLSRPHPSLEPMAPDKDPTAVIAVSETSEGRPALGSCIVRSTKFFEEEKVRIFIADQSIHQDRIKGYIRIDELHTMAIQTVFKDISIRLICGYEGPSELIVIGSGLNNREFSKQFLSLQ